MAKVEVVTLLVVLEHCLVRVEPLVAEVAVDIVANVPHGDAGNFRAESG